MIRIDQLKLPLDHGDEDLAEAACALRDVLRIMKDRCLWTRGKLGAERVKGGIPPAVRRAMSGG